MKRSRVRVGISILVVLILCGLAGFELSNALAPDASADVQIRRLDSYWGSRRREAAAALGQFSAEADKVVPVLVKALGDSDTGVRLNALESLKNFGEKAKPAGSVLVEMLKRDPDGKIRQRAATLMGVTKDRGAVAVLS
jgi:HEAT repeat protein